MALRNQPYIPLFVQDFLTDEKLMECSAQATGVYIRVMCIMHKSDEYGTILLKQKDKQSDEQIINFALKLAKHMPYINPVIVESLRELVAEGVLIIEGDKLFQKRMVRDGIISDIRAKSGKKGGDKNKFAQANIEAKVQANSEIEYEYEIENKLNSKDVFVIYDAKQLCDELWNSTEWLNNILISTIAKSKKIELNPLKDYITEYIEEQRIKSTLNRSIGEYKRHFFNWFKKKMETYTPPKKLNYVN